MPAPIYYSHRSGLNGRPTCARTGRPPLVAARREEPGDPCATKTMVKPVAIDAVVLSTQHNPDVSTGVISCESGDGKHYPLTVLPAELVARRIPSYHINPTGQFIIGGPGGRLRPDRAQDYRRYLRRYGAPRRRRLLRQRPLQSRTAPPPTLAATWPKTSSPPAWPSAAKSRSPTPSAWPSPPPISINTFGTNNLPEEHIEALVRDHFDLRPKGIVDMLDLKRPIYRPTAAYGHFGRNDSEFHVGAYG